MNALATWVCDPVKSSRKGGGISLLLLVVVLALAGLVGWQSGVQAQGRPTLFVFLNTEMKPNVLQQTLQQKLPAVEVTVFGRFKDFEKSAASMNPDAVLALRPVIEGVGLKPGLQGTIGGLAEESYVLLAIERQVSASELANLTIGSVDLLGRAKMPGFVANVIGITGDAKVKLVTKTDDLLPLLQFKEADVVLLPERQAHLLIGKTALNLKSTLAPKRVPLPAIAVRTSAGQAIADGLRQLDAATTRAMGMESWK